MHAKPARGVKLHFVVLGNRGSHLIDRRSWAHAGSLVVPFAADGTRLTAYVSGSIGTGPISSAKAVLAFQKAAGLPRTSLADRSTLARLAAATAPKARYAGHGLHIEIDKTRQILMLVRNGKVTGTLHVSTGATGNTPVGQWSVLWKAPFTHTWLGPAILWRTMTFHGGFAIHGFSPVPAYPASHGCVRETIWAANWTYEQTPVGTPVDVY